MIVVAVVLILMAAAASVLVLSGSVGGMQIDVANFQLTTSSGAMFLTGVIATLSLGLGVYLMRLGTRRALKQRRDAKAAGGGTDQAGFTVGSDRGPHA